MRLHFVTVGSGFVGRHTAQDLLDRDDVRIYDLAPPDAPTTELDESIEFPPRRWT